MATVMAKALPAGGGPPLPEDLVIWDILMRLPVKPLLRCRAVCRSWCRRLTSDPKFLLAHSRRQPSLQLVTTSDSEESRIDALDHRTGERRPVARMDRLGIPEDRDHLDVLASCDGLLVLIAQGGLYICNPTTRQRAALTPIYGGSWISGLYSHRPSGSYRVLCCFKRAEDGHAVYYVHTVGSEEVRCVGEPPELWASGDMVLGMPMLQLFNPPVLAGGRLYWNPIKLPGGNGKVNNILVFDAMAESFQHVFSPVQGASTALFETNSGNLGLFDYNSVRTLDLWVLQDYNSWAWSLNNRINLVPRVFFSAPIPDTEDVLAISAKGETGILYQHLHHISGADGSVLARYEWTAYLKLNKHTFKESLVRHDFFSTEGSDVGVDEKPLFDRLSTVAVARDDNSELH